MKDRVTHKSRLTKGQLFSIGLVILLLGLFLYISWQKYYILPNKLPTREPCDFHSKPCQVRIEGGKKIVSLEISPKIILAGKNLTFKVKLQNINVQKVELYIAAMDNITHFKKIELLLEPKDKTFQAETTLDQAKIKEQGWLVLIHVYTPEENITVPYRLYPNQTLNQK